MVPAKERLIFSMSRIVSQKSVFDFAACFFLIASHFINHAVYLKYSRFFPDILVALAILALIAAGLTAILSIRSFLIRAFVWSLFITVIFGDFIFELGVADREYRLVATGATLVVALAVILFLKENASKVLLVTFSLFFLTTIVLPLYRYASEEAKAHQIKPGDETLPNIVHIVLDEFIGYSGIRDGLPGASQTRRALVSIFQENGFALYGNAYSPYANTAFSLAAMLNQSTGNDARNFLTKKRNKWILEGNNYFDKAMARGYAVRVYQSNYMDFCKAYNAAVCTTYNHDEIAAKTIASVPTSERVSLLLNSYYGSIAVIRLARLYEPLLIEWLGEFGIQMPGIVFWHGRVGPIAAMPTFDTLVEDISAAPRGGTMFFAHLLMPHYPYVFDRDCNIRTPVTRWKLRHGFNKTNSAASRGDRYADYFEQVECTLKQLRSLFDNMKRRGTFENSIIIVHGDHGARINLFDPVYSNKDRLNADGFIDSFSTLYAIKTPHAGAAINFQMLSLPHLLAKTVDFGWPVPPESLSPKVYLQRENHSFQPVTLPPFPALR